MVENFPIVNPDKCVSCGICVKTGPKKYYRVSDPQSTGLRALFNKKLGKHVKQVCQVGGIGCKMLQGKRAYETPWNNPQTLLRIVYTSSS